ncbi:uncharacterized protein Tco025E_06381 [Trypanosoma conorhini]|uniref:Uncharacterized protein n=1 Tax=Trypanosoma conorhini TaxID=83891 RepID=A0A3R7KPM6_9TRYP|nr:uncharacterized protein Tco025E_06381 [Trypanosoma conorhini]RNF12965.1 hypothetical protein Tco025E_06381 [Trypanosoma conorhini]
MFEGPVECCECAAPVGDEGALRAVLILPCQHLLHAGCVDYIRKRRKLEQLIVRGDRGGMGAAQPAHLKLAGGKIDTKSSGSSGSGSGSNVDGGGSRLVACPACMVPIRRLIPLFPSGGDARAAARVGGGGEAESHFTTTHKAQKSHIAQLRALYEQRERVTQLTRTCALMHERLSEAQAEVDRLSRVLPSVAPAAHVPQLAGENLCVEGMTATELEMYILHSSATLEELEHDVGEQRRLAEKKRRKLSHFHARFQAMKALGESARHTHRRKEETSSSGNESPGHSVGRGRRPRVPPVVDVEEEESAAKTRAMSVSSGSGICDGEEQNQPRQQREAAEERGFVKANLDGGVDAAEEGAEDGGDDDVVYVDHTAPHFASSGSSGSPTAADASSHAWRTPTGTEVSMDGRSRGESNRGSGNDGVFVADVGGDDGGDDAMMCYSPMPRAAPLQQSGIRVPNAARLLPRREDRLWQPSLEGLL